ncbi:RHS repeat-associated core domain-containing protein [Thermobifida halotolerans]|uniref:RHS repeat-associated core domain-containing protein n=1 Tax=Thermobifida halotolerans TaxID=483545 RepID=A0A399G750_9ACTN|nr:RHS repeat-associated core domain-containing protein [Thermobifida halotolerans]UOE20672.1 RHS repeat-associated core domain-containing protein [Thermobifida halotolerans]
MENGAETEFRCNADGQRLIRGTPQDATLYLPGMEVHLDKIALLREAVRYYDHAGETVALRQDDKTLHWLFSDHHGTGGLTIDAQSGQTVQRRFTAFGSICGSTGQWLDEKGFVGDTIDETTGLVQLGTRAYDSAIGRFVSNDPVIDFTDPQQVHGYVYANNNPVSFSDPDGLKLMKRYKRPRLSKARAASRPPSRGFAGSSVGRRLPPRPTFQQTVLYSIRKTNAMVNRIPFAPQFRDASVGSMIALYESSPMVWITEPVMEHSTGMSMSESMRIVGVNKNSGW